MALDKFPRSLYFVEMPKGEYVGEFELLILLAALRLGKDAYGMQVRREIAACTGRDAAIGAVYATLERLVSKGLMRAREMQPENGRPRRLYEATAAGKSAVQRTQDAIASLSKGLRLGAKHA